MRFRLPLGRAAFFLAAFAFALVALLPMRLALDWLGLDSRGLAAREATGSIWLGALKEAQLGPVPLGDVGARLNSLPLLIGRARLSMSRRGEADDLEGAAIASRHRFGLEDVTGQARLGSLFAPLPITQLDLDGVSVGFTSDQCDRAEGAVRATLAGDVGGIALPSGLTGDVRCAEGALLLPLASQTGMEQLNLRLYADGRYRAELLVRPSEPAARERLAAAGFMPAGAGMARVIEGRF